MAASGAAWKNAIGGISLTIQRHDIAWPWAGPLSAEACRD
jgi:hypothetical protein